MVDPYSPEPLSRQLAAEIRRQIEQGELRQREWLPSEGEMSREYEVSRDTVRAALAILREEGLVASIKGRGTYVL